VESEVLGNTKLLRYDIEALQLIPIEALCYKPESRGFDSSWGYCIFYLAYSFQPHYGPGVDSASNINEYQEFSWGKGRPAREADNLTAICEPIV
jgi:hypothetical protein